MPLVCAEILRIWLDGHVVFQEDKSHGVAGKLTDEPFRIFYHASGAPMQCGDVQRVFHGKEAEFFRVKTAVPGDIGQHFFGRLTGEAPYGRADHGSRRKNRLMNGQEIDDVAGFPPVRCC